MDGEFLLPGESIRAQGDLPNGCYLLRKGVSISNCVYRAGTVVELVDGAWFLHETLKERTRLSLNAELVCRTSYDGVSLHELECTDHGVLFSSPVLSDSPPVTVDPIMVHLLIQRGESRVCIKFGHCFLPLELFDW